MQQFVDTRNFLSQTKFYEGYSRYKDGEGRYETWDEAVDRVIDMHEQNYITNNNRLQPFVEEARTAYKEQRVLGAQRALQFGGDQLMKHQMRMYNCTSSCTGLHLSISHSLYIYIYIYVYIYICIWRVAG